MFWFWLGLSMLTCRKMTLTRMGEVGPTVSHQGKVISHHGKVTSHVGNLLYMDNLQGSQP